MGYDNHLDKAPITRNEWLGVLLVVAGIIGAAVQLIFF